MSMSTLLLMKYWDWKLMVSVLALIVSVFSIFFSYYTGKRLQERQHEFAIEQALEHKRRQIVANGAIINGIMNTILYTKTPPDGKGIEKIVKVYSDSRNIYESTKHYFPESGVVELDNQINTIEKEMKEYLATGSGFGPAVVKCAHFVNSLLESFPKELVR